MTRRTTGSLQVDFLPASALGTPGRLGLTRAPGLWIPGRTGDSDDWLRDDLAELTRMHGAKVLVTLLERSELARIGDLEREAQQASLRWIHFPVPDMWVPDLAAARKLVAKILAALNAGDHVVIHCLAGLGRSGTIAAACLVARGMEPSKATRTVRAARPGAIQSEAQELFIRAFAEEADADE